MTIETVNSKCDSGQLDENLTDFLIKISSEKLGGESFLLVYKHDEICLGMIKNGTINNNTIEKLELDTLTELRLFCKVGELHLWKKRDIFLWRLRIDGEGKKYSVYEEDHIIWGTEVAGSFILKEEYRGMELKFPFPIEKSQLPLKYKVRNYLEPDDDCLMNFIDSRIITLLNKHGDDLNA